MMINDNISYNLNPCSNISAPTALSIISATFCSVLSATAVTGNFLVLFAVIIDPNRNLRSPFSFLVANLAAADLMVGCFALPMSVDFYIRESLTHHPVLLRRDHARRVGSFISCMASLLSLAALSVDRMNAITDPHRYRIKLSTKRVAIVSLVLWIVSSGLPFLYFQVGYLKYQFFFANTTVVATFTVLCLTYAKVLKKMKQQVKNCTALHGGNNRNNHVKMRAIKSEKKITKTYLIMLALFICCFLPSLILIYVISFCGSCNCVFIHWARDFNYILIMANSSMNPFVFAWRLEAYRKAFAKIIRCGKIPRKLRSSSVHQEPTSVQLNLPMNV